MSNMQAPNAAIEIVLFLWRSSSKNTLLRSWRISNLAMRCLRVHCRCLKSTVLQAMVASTSDTNTDTPARTAYTITTLSYELLSRSWITPVMTRTIIFILFHLISGLFRLQVMAASSRIIHGNLECICRAKCRGVPEGCANAVDDSRGTKAVRKSKYAQRCSGPGHTATEAQKKH